VRYLKDLLIEVKRVLKQTPAAETPELEKAMDAAEKFLTESKSFEYIGEINMPNSIIKLTDAGTDLDDVMRLLAGKRNDIKIHGEIYIVVYKQETPAEDAKAA
jgi:hypothetical protein